MKIANRDARKFVQTLHPFEGHNLHAQFHTQRNEDGTHTGDWYAVYSYKSWPLFVYAEDTWFENEDRYGTTTSKHRTQTHPHCPTVLLSARWMERLAKGGYNAIAQERILQGEPA